MRNMKFRSIYKAPEPGSLHMCDAGPASKVSAHTALPQQHVILGHPEALESVPGMWLAGAGFVCRGDSLTS